MNYLKTLMLKNLKKRQNEVKFNFSLFSAQFKSNVLLAISGRELIAVLQIDENLEDWFNAIINEYGLMQKYEYLFIDFKGGMALEKNQYEYDIYLSVAAAKLICVINKGNLSFEIRRQLILAEEYFTNLTVNDSGIKRTNHKLPTLQNIQYKAMIEKSWFYTILYLEKHINSGGNFIDRSLSDIALSLNEKIRREIVSDVNLGYRNIKIKNIRNWRPRNGNKILKSVLQQGNI